MAPPSLNVMAALGVQPIANPTTVRRDAADCRVQQRIQSSDHSSHSPLSVRWEKSAKRAVWSLFEVLHVLPDCRPSMLCSDVELRVCFATLPELL